MPLQSNIAILYAQGKLGQKISLADDAGIDTTIDSPYNVYTPWLLDRLIAQVRMRLKQV